MLWKNLWSVDRSIWARRMRRWTRKGQEEIKMRAFIVFIEILGIFIVYILGCFNYLMMYLEKRYIHFIVIIIIIMKDTFFISHCQRKETSNWTRFIPLFLTIHVCQLHDWNYEYPRTCFTFAHTRTFPDEHVERSIRRTENALIPSAIEKIYIYIFHPCFLYFVLYFIFYSCVFSLLVLLLW